MSGLLAVLGGFGLISAALGIVVGWPQAITVALVLFAGQYGISLLGRDGIDPAAPLVAAGLLLFAELAFISLAVAAEAPLSPAGRRFEARRVTVVVVGGGLVAALLLAVVRAPFAGGPWLSASGVGAAAALTALLAVLVRRAT
ncbi:MAG: hypothetical protein H0W51_02880 [Euzebyales bacterium]|nr:hypothetical protein [Euzebyales bacterium]